VSVTCRRLPADDLERIRVPDDVAVGDGQVAVLLTDHARRDGFRPIVAEADTEAGTGLVSLPSLGALRLGQRATLAVERVVDELRGEAGGRGLGPFEREDGSPVRFVTGGRHGRLRLLAGMVRANRPWLLVPHLSKAFASALAILAYAILNPTIWQLAGSLGAGRMALAALLAISIMVAWLIVDHEMWERPDDEHQRDLAVLFNVATLGQHLRVVWLVASFATVAGAVGTGFESDEAVRMAAYGHRQRERLERDEPPSTDSDER
jgi:hypothetical protein